MKNYFILLLLCFTTITVVSQNTITYEQVRQAGLHIVEITTVNNEEPEGTIVESPLFPGSYNMVYKNKVPCKIVISKDGQIIYDSDEYIQKKSGATIRINGNTTAYFSYPQNMPYKIKLEKAADLLCRGNDSIYKDKEWRLIKDAVSLNTMIGLKISQLLDLEWTPAYIPCNVIINGNYRGCYLLIENMKKNELCRINCDKQTGYIIEKDPYWWKETKYFSSNRYKDDNVYRWTWKYPDSDEVNEEQEKYIKQYIESMEESLSNGNYEFYIDIMSFAKWILVHDILGTRDSWGSNMFIKKYDNTDNSRLQLPCVWDFDSSYDVTPGSFSLLHTQENEYFHTLFNSSNRTFATTYVTLWNEKKTEIFNKLYDFLNEYSNSDEANALDISRVLNNKRWNYNYSTVNENIQHTYNWLQNHIELLDQNIQLIEITSGITQNRVGINNTGKTYYNLNAIKYNNKIKKNIQIFKNENSKAKKVITK